MPALAYFDPALAKILLHTDASKEGPGTVVLQETSDSVQRVISYASRHLIDLEQHYHSSAGMPACCLGFPKGSSLPLDMLLRCCH